MKCIAIFISGIMLALSATAQDWTLKDSGAGLIQDNGEYRVPKIIERGTRWDMVSLAENGAMDGKYRGNQLFTAWIRGPERKEFSDAKGDPAWLYKYTVTNPSGIVRISKPGEFNSSGYAFISKDDLDNDSGIWKIEWYLVNRQKLKETHVATTIFESVNADSASRTGYSIKAVSTLKSTTPPRVIFDTDIDSDVDDVGALAMLLNMHRGGSIVLLGVIVTSDDPYSPVCASAIMKYYGCSDIPLGFYKGNAAMKNHSRYSRFIAEEFPAVIKSWKEAEEAVSLYRRLLNDNPDNSVTILTTGHLSSLMLLLESGADKITALTGRSLASRKAERWICMGGQYPSGKEANFYRPDPASTVFCLENWGRDIIFIGWEAGNEIITGGSSIKSRLTEEHPLYRSYELYNNFAGRSSWDQLAVLQLTDIAERFHELSKAGRCVAAKDGSNRWVEDQKGKHRYIIQRPGVKNEEISGFLDNLMTGL